ncbi:MAG: radical SAM family heme chaperone HemW [Bacteroidaceae bacterium]|nr:radical SAM family heme chaperone HemW [Bacteroidaceae bacterium]
MAGLYIHIPFCKQRCRYCSFFSSTKEEKKREYIDALCKELQLRKEYIDNRNIETIYIGGGTPSTLQKEDFEKIFGTIKSHYDIKEGAEVTLEANPDDLSRDYLTMLRSFPFNRLSMGVQSFNDELLKKLGRRHDARRAIEAFRDARAAGFENISIDLMFALPDSTPESWSNDLEAAVQLRPEHISAYNLTYEEGTALYKAMQNGKITPLDEEENLRQFTTLIDRLGESGYHHYEISNFALPGHESRHNSSYWHGTPYLGCGAAAHSYNGASRQWNIANIELYIKGIKEGAHEYEIEILTESERYNDAVLTRLRTYDGLPLEWFKEKFEKKYVTHILKNAAEHIARGTLTHGNDNCIRLTKNGIFISDAIIRDLIYID